MSSSYYQAGYKQVDLPHHQFGNDIGGGGAVPEFDRETRPAHIPGQQMVSFESKPSNRSPLFCLIESLSGGRRG